MTLTGFNMQSFSSFFLLCRLCLPFCRVVEISAVRAVVLFLYANYSGQILNSIVVKMYISGLEWLLMFTAVIGDDVSVIGASEGCL